MAYRRPSGCNVMKQFWVALTLLVFVTGCSVLSPSNARPSALPANFLPTTVAFWTNADGLVAGTSGCPKDCTVYAASTTDGGASWTVRLHISTGESPMSPTISIEDPSTGWMLYENCKVAGPPTHCVLASVVTTDTGRVWNSGPVQAAIFSVADGRGWMYQPSGFSARGLYRVSVGHDGRGISGNLVTNPCDTLPSRTVAFDATGPESGYLVCASSPTNDLEAKDLYRTDNGGRNWTRVLSVASGNLEVKGLRLSDLVDGVEMFSDGQGWLWGSSLLKTSDFGVSWVPVHLAPGVFGPVRATSFTSPRTGYVLVNSKKGLSLFLTDNAGKTWRSVGRL